MTRLKRRYGKTNSVTEKRALTEAAQVATHGDDSIDVTSAAVETMRDQRKAGLALWAAVGAMAIGIANFFQVLLDRATETV